MPKQTITTAGATALVAGLANGTPVSIIGFRIGSRANFDPAVTDTDVHTPVYPAMGAELTGLSFNDDENQINFRITLAASLGPFDVGNIGLFIGSTENPQLLALFTLDTADPKTATVGAIEGNILTYDIILNFADAAATVDLSLVSRAENHILNLHTVDSEDDLAPAANSAIKSALVRDYNNTGQAAFAHVLPAGNGQPIRWRYEVIGGSVPNASTSVRGIVQLATANEAKAGTDTEKAVTPAALQGALDDLGGGVSGVRSGQSANYTVLTSDDGRIIEVNAAGGARTVSLPDLIVANNGFTITVVKVDSSANLVTIDGNGADTINGAANYVLRSQWESVILKWTGTQWLAIGQTAIQASTTRRGLVELATTTESRGSSSTLAVPPSGVQSAIAAALAGIGGVTGNADAKTASYTVVSSDNGKTLEISAAGGARTVNLPDLSSTDDGFTVTVIKTDSSDNTVTIDGHSTDTINGETTYVLESQWESVILKWTGSVWIAIGGASTSWLRDFFGGASRREYTTAGAHTYMWEWDTPNGIAILIGGGGGGGGGGSSHARGLTEPNWGGGGGGGSNAIGGGGQGGGNKNGGNGTLTAGGVGATGGSQAGSGGSGGSASILTIKGTTYYGHGGGGGGGGSSYRDGSSGAGGNGGNTIGSGTAGTRAGDDSGIGGLIGHGGGGHGGGGNNGGAGGAAHNAGNGTPGGAGGGGVINVVVLSGLSKNDSFSITIGAGGAGGAAAANGSAAAGTAGTAGRVILIPLF